MKKKFDLLIPFYCPPEGWLNNMEQLVQDLEQDANVEFSIILVNDGTNGIEKEFLGRYSQKIIFVNRDENIGKGSAIRLGLGYSENDVLITDVDIPYSYSTYLNFIQHSINTKGDSSILAKRDATYYRNMPLDRKIISQLFRNTIILLFGKRFKDVQAGLKILNNNGKEIYLETNTNRFLSDFEFALLAKRRRIKIDTIIVKLRDNVKFKSLGISTIVKELSNLWKIIIRKFTINKK